MKTLKIALIGAVAATVSLSSFMALNHNPEELPVDKALYAKFLGNFEKKELPYSIQFERPKTEADVEKMYGWNNDREKGYGNELGFEFAQFIPSLERGYMSRMGPDEFYADALLASNDKFSAVIYKRKPNYQNHITTYTLATFDAQGKMISQRTIASCYADYFEEPTITKDLAIKIEHFKANYLEDAKKSITYNLEKTEQMHIDAKGMIVAAGEEKGDNKNLKKTIQSDLWDN